MPGQLYKAAAIVGAAEANEIGFLDEPVTALQLHIEAIDLKTGRQVWQHHR